MLLVLAPLFVAAFPCLLAPQVGKNPIELDRTGVPWAASFEDALARARSEKRLLFLLPDNDPHSTDGAFGFECFRAGALCDERVRALLELRFVCFYFNCSKQTAAFDAEALAFVVTEKKEFGKENQTFQFGIPALVMTPQGKLVSEVSTYMPIDDVHDELLRALKKSGPFDAPSEAEKAAKEPLAKARFLFARGELDAAEALLKKEKSPEAVALRAEMARLAHDWKKLKKVLAEMDAASPDAAVERGHALLADQKFDEAATLLHGVDGASARGDEARYLEGLAHIGQKDEKGALEIWKVLIEGRPEGPWIYRADWARASVLVASAGETGEYRGQTSLIGHEGYFGPVNPDLPKIKK